MQSTQASNARALAPSRGRRRATRPFTIAQPGTWRGVLWTVVIALDFFWVSDPRVLTPFDDSLRNACVVTVLAVLATLPQARWPRPAWSVLCVVIVGFTSVLWSAYPDVSYAFTMKAVLVAALATTVVTYADARTVAHGMTLGGVVVLAVSWFALARDMPGAAVPLGTQGHLAGVGGNRNILAYTLVIALAFAVSQLPSRPWGRALALTGTAILLVGLYLAESGTGMVAALVVVASAVALALVDRRGPSAQARSARRRWRTRGIVLGALVAGMVAVDLIGRLLGRDLGSLSGRVPLWESIWSSTTGAQRWFGAGWGAVWPHGWEPAPPNPDFLEIIGRTGFWLGHGHNAALDLLPEIGLVGVVVVALTYVQAVAGGLAQRDPALATPARLQASRTVLLGVGALVLFGLTEPMSTIPLGWFTIVVLATGLSATEPGTPGRRRLVRHPVARRTPAGTPPDQP